MEPIQSTQAKFSTEQNTTGLQHTGAKRTATTYLTAPKSKHAKKHPNIYNRSTSNYYKELADSLPEIYRNMTKQGSTQG